MDGIEAWDLQRARAHEHIDAPERQHGARGAADQGEREALDEQLPDDAQTAGAEGGAHGDFPSPRCAAREEQIRNIRTGDQQNCRHCAEQHDQREPVVLHQHVPERPDEDAARSVARVCGVHARPDRRELRLRRRQRDPGPQTSNRLQKRGAALVRPLRREARGEDRHPDLRRILGADWKLESGRHDADDDDGIAVEERRLAHNRSIAVEAIDPQCFGDDRRPFGAVLVVVGREDAAGDRLHTEQWEEIRCHDCHRNRRGLAAAGQRDCSRRVGGDAIDGRGLRAPVEEVEVRRIIRLVPYRRIDRHEPRGVSKRERREQYALNDAEDSGVGADAESEHDHDQRAEARSLGEESECVAEVGEHQ